MSEKELLPCPFCGGTDFDVTQWIECNGCGAFGPSPDNNSDYEAAWNRRAERAQLRAEVEALRKDAERYRFIIDCPLRTMVALSRKAHEPDFDLSAECDSIIASRDAAMAAKEGV